MYLFVSRSERSERSGERSERNGFVNICSIGCWECDLEFEDWNIIRSLDFNTVIFDIEVADLDLALDFARNLGPVSIHIFLRALEARDILFQCQTDRDLHMHVHFLENL